MTTRDLVDAPPVVVARLRRSVALTKGEAIDACQALADAERALTDAGQLAEVRALASLFELIEDRLARA